MVDYKPLGDIAVVCSLFLQFNLCALTSQYTTGVRPQPPSTHIPDSFTLRHNDIHVDFVLTFIYIIYILIYIFSSFLSL